MRATPNTELLSVDVPVGKDNTKTFSVHADITSYMASLASLSLDLRWVLDGPSARPKWKKFGFVARFRP